MHSATSSKNILHFTESGSGMSLLPVHGLMVNGDMFEPVIDHFTMKYRVIVPDLRGHGRSRNLPPPYTPGQLAADLAKLLDHLGIESAQVLGYSQGGAIAQQFALDYPGRCSSLVLACTYAFNMATFSEKFEGHLTPVLLNLLGMKRFAKLVVSQAMKQLNSDRANQVASFIAKQDRRMMVAAWKEVMVFDSRHRLSGIKCPTLIIAGSKDNAVPMHHARMLHEGIAGSQLSVVDGANHALIWTHTEEFIHLIDEFIALHI